MHIEIKKDLIPYRFDMEFANEIFTFELNYNSRYDFFTIGLYLDQEPIIIGEKIVYGKPLFNTIESYESRLPRAYIIPLETTGKAVERVTWDNFGDTVQLLIGEMEE